MSGGGWGSALSLPCLRETDQPVSPVSPPAPVSSFRHTSSVSYIFNNYSPATPATDKPSFSSIIHTAKSLGYTEPDPRDDLSGVDVARKLTILSRQIPSLAKRLDHGWVSLFAVVHFLLLPG